MSENSQKIIEQAKPKKSSLFFVAFGLVFMGGMYLSQKQRNSAGNNNNSKRKFSSNNNNSENKNKSNNNNNSDKNKQNEQQQQQNNSEKQKSQQNSQKTPSQDFQIQESQIQQSGETYFERLLTESAKKQKSIKVLITTENKEKISALKNAIIKLFPEIQESNLEIKPVKCESGIPHGQPWGTQHTYEGANARIQSLQDQFKNSKVDSIENYDFIVSIENGVFDILMHTGTRGVDIACIIIKRKIQVQQQNKWVYSLGFSQGRTYPLEKVFEAKKSGVTNKEIGDLIKNYYNDRPMLQSRFDQIQQGVEQVFSNFFINNQEPIVQQKTEIQKKQQQKYFNTETEDNEEQKQQLQEEQQQINSSIKENNIVNMSPVKKQIKSFIE